jgi:hypothetical protein
MRFSGLSEIRAYWEALRPSDGGPPGRARFDPRGIERALPQAFLATLEPGAAGTPAALVMRVVGQDVAALARADLRGASPLALIDAADHAAVAQVLEAVLADPACAELDLDGPAAPGGGAGSHRPARMLLLPMADDLGWPGYVLGGLAMARPLPRDQACTLGLRTVRLTRLTAPSPQAAAVTAPALPLAGLAQGPGLAEPGAPYRPDTPPASDPGPPASGARRGHLRIVK